MCQDFNAIFFDSVIKSTSKFWPEIFPGCGQGFGILKLVFVNFVVGKDVLCTLWKIYNVGCRLCMVLMQKQKVN